MNSEMQGSRAALPYHSASARQGLSEELPYLRDPEAKPSCKQSPEHLWEREAEQSTPTESVDREHCRPCKSKVDQAESPREEQRM